SDIFAMNADGTGYAQLTNDANMENALIWSPDGTKLAFSSLSNATNLGAELDVISADGSGRKQLRAPLQTASALYGTHSGLDPSWSPDSQSIVYTAERYTGSTDTDLEIVTLDGTVTQLTTGSAS